jgi:hypothetical protein
MCFFPDPGHLDIVCEGEFSELIFSRVPLVRESGAIALARTTIGFAIAFKIRSAGQSRINNGILKSLASCDSSKVIVKSMLMFSPSIR